MTAKLSVLFDGACPLCVREIAFYRRLRGADALDWIDVSAGGPDVAFCGISARDARARFHVVLPGGTPVSGAAAFVEIWRRLPAFRPLAVLLGHRPGVWIMDRAYSLFLKIRPRLQRLAARS
jgi:predicted DCC family thiol-disulfide oxidoreductase YuxK